MSSTLENLEAKGWKVNREIPVTFIATLIFATVTNFAAGVWYASSMSSRMERVEYEVQIIKQENKDQDKNRDDTLTRLSRIETDYIATKSDVSRRLDRLEAKIDSIIDRLPSRSQ